MMNKKDWDKIIGIIPEILEIGDGNREKYLDKSELKPEIRREILSLLAFEHQTDDFMSLSAGDLTKDFFTEDEKTENALNGKKIGVYKIIREIGLGGLGAVYLAERCDEKFSQKVAIKMLKSEFNVESLRRNFEREKQILSKLEHPYIARLLDAGTTDDGTPFLAMEYIEGVPVDKFCAEKNLDFNSRLKIFNKICEAVAFAHQNLIIHRDIKPSNIIVNSKGEPKLLDFGISKLLDEKNENQNQTITMLGAMTPQYASPEQIKGENVTTATDIYSLGMVLYKMLTGVLPYDFAGKINGEIFKAISETEPIKPSAVFQEREKERKGERETMNDGTNFSPSSFHAFSPSQLKGDIDNILLKSLSKESMRRYQTVEQFSADIWRHIDGLPVSARSSTFAYKFNKFIRRNKIAVVAAALIFVSLISGIAVAFRQANIANEQARSASESRNTALIETEKAKNEQLKAEKISRFMSKIIGYANPNWYAEGAKSKGQARVLDALEDLSDKIDVEFANEPDVAAELHHKFGESFSNASRQYTGETQERLQKKHTFHILRALELRKQFYGEHHELVAKDMFYAIATIPKNWQERAEMLMKAINMMRETNPNNLNYPYMIESYSSRLMMPETPETHEIYRQAVQPATNENKYQIAERMLRESLPVFRFHYKKDNSAIIAAECRLSYALAMQKKWTDFDEHFQICKQTNTDSSEKFVVNEIQSIMELTEKFLSENNK